jgi:hypothetical protein
MGLNCSHECYDGGYGQFQAFRQCVAKVVGIPLDVMEGFFDLEGWLVSAGFGPHSEERRERLTERLEIFPLSWEPWADDPITLFLNHSDCEGEIRWQDAVAIAERLEEIAPHIVWKYRKDWDFTARCIQFAEGLRFAASRKENVEFH